MFAKSSEGRYLRQKTISLSVRSLVRSLLTIIVHVGTCLRPYFLQNGHRMESRQRP